MKKSKVEKMFGELLCNDEVLAKYMPRGSYASYKSIKAKGEPLDARTASSVAKAIKNWSIENGATHFSHWFAPLNGKTAEKQVSFIEINQNGKTIEDFNEKSLIKGETDASSFPNGGERLTFEARGYTVWDYTSPVFIKEDTSKNRVVYIPTAFCSYTGTALDEKTPLLRAIESLNTQSLRVLKHLGYDKVKKVNCNVGAEQEYFLIKTADYEKRIDLKMTGRTLLGDNGAKTQEVCAHYFGMINDSISAFMNEVDRELWRMGINAKLQHNEVAPCQHELVPIFNSVNIASDQNQIIMEVIHSIASKHNLTALFHEKPFANINGSGKHINWSLSTDNGINLLDSNLSDETLFLTFFTSMISAIDRYYKLIRSSTAYRGNDLRLGGNEAPPTLISVFIGEKLEELLNTVVSERKSEASTTKVLDTRVKTLPKTVKDYCDRNRTSPFAFGGNKFEFRMVGSSQSIAWPSTCICAIMSKVLGEMADKLDEAIDKKLALNEILKENIIEHRKIVFNGNGYDDEWKIEAEKRKLVEYKDSISSYAILDDKDIIDLFESTQIIDKNELALRKSTLIKHYVEEVKVEGKTILEMLSKQIFPCLTRYITDLSTSVNNYKSNAKIDARVIMLERIDDAYGKLFEESEKLSKFVESLKGDNLENSSKIAKEKVAVSLNKIKNIFDDVEKIIPDYLKPFPSYSDILF